MCVFLNWPYILILLKGGVCVLSSWIWAGLQWLWPIEAGRSDAAQLLKLGGTSPRSLLSVSWKPLLWKLATMLRAAQATWRVYTWVLSPVLESSQPRYHRYEGRKFQTAVAPKRLRLSLRLIDWSSKWSWDKTSPWFSVPIPNSGSL